MKARDILLAAAGGGAVSVRLDTDTYQSENVSPALASAGFTVGNDSNLTVAADTGIGYAWLTNGTPANYEIRATETAGTVSSGTVGSWLALSTSRTWTVTRSTVGSKDATITVEIRDAASPFTVRATASISLSAVGTL